MADINRRLDRIEAQLTPPAEVVSWTAVDAAMRRQQARARLTVCDLLGVDPDDPRYAEAAVVLADDSPAVQAQDDAILTAWRRQEGIIEKTKGARQRVMEQIDLIASRLSASHQRIAGTR